MATVSRNPNPWLNEPRCDNGACHGSGYRQDQPLYRMSKEHGGVYCEACHDSTHAIAPSRQPNDAIKFYALQGHAGTLDTCTVCHASQPSGPGPHGIVAPTPEVTVTPTLTPIPAPTLTPLPTTAVRDTLFLPHISKTHTLRR